MANILGKLLIELGVNIAAFKEGLDKATYMSKATAASIKKELESIGDSFAKLGSMFGQLPAGFGLALGGLQKGLGALTSAAGPVGAAVGVAATAALALTAGTIALTASAASAANQIFLLAQATGLSVPALSGLSAVAKTVGIDTQQLALGLERMDKNAVLASTAPAGAANAFTRLGISVKEANGQMKPTEELFSEISEKFSGMEDGTAKTALAMQIFGRAGAALIPLLNQGSENIKALIGYAKDVGAVLTDEAAEGAHKFETDLVKLQLAGQGVQNTLMSQFLPALTSVTEQIGNALKDSQSGLHDFLNGVTVIAKYTLEFFELVVAVFHQVGMFIGDGIQLAIEFGKTFNNVLQTLYDNGKNIFIGFAKLLAGDVIGAGKIFANVTKQIAPQMEEGLGRSRAVLKTFIDDSAKMWVSFADTTRNIFDPVKEAPEQKKKKKKGPSITGEDKGAENIEGRIRALEEQAEEEGKLAGAIKSTVSETLLATAAAKADLEIGKLEIIAKKQHTQVTDAQKDRVRAAALELAAYKAALDVNSSLEKSIVKTQESTQALKDQAAAYSDGAKAVVLAQEKGKLEPYIRQVDELQKAYDAMAVSGKFSAQGLATLKQALDDSKVKLQQETDALHAEELAKEKNNAAKFLDSLKTENTEIEKQITATLLGAAALRDYAKEKQIAAFIKENPFLTPEQIAALRSDLSHLSQQEAQLAAAQAVAAQNRRKDLQEEIVQLQKLRAAAVSAGKDTLAYDAAIHQAQQQKIKDYSNELLATGRVKDGAKAFFIDFVNQSKITGDKVYSLLKTSFDGVNQSLAQMITTGKANWASFFDQLGQQIINMALQWIEAKTIMLVMNKLFDSSDDDSATKQKQSNSSLAASAAALAGANTLAITSAVYLPPTPEILSGVAFSMGMGFSSLAAFDHGGVVSDDMLAQVHKDEMVLPPDIARTVMNASKFGASSAQTGRPIYLTLQHNVNAIDAEGVHAVMQEHMPMLAQMVVQEVRRHN